jgi:thiol-disulfide isomerase/thioredoxin
MSDILNSEIAPMLLRFACAVAVLLACAPLFASERTAAPGFQLWNRDGGRTQLSNLQGSIVVLNFWATWCGPCRAEVPSLNRIHEDYGRRGVTVLGVAMDERGWAAVTPFLAEYRVAYPILLGTPAVARSYGGLRTLPCTVFIDRDGRVMATYDGVVPEKQLRRILDLLVDLPTLLNYGQ